MLDSQNHFRFTINKIVFVTTTNDHLMSMVVAVIYMYTEKEYFINCKDLERTIAIIVIQVIIIAIIIAFWSLW